MMLRQVLLVLLLVGMLHGRESVRRGRRPVAYLRGTNPKSEIYPPNTDITQFDVDGPLRGLTYGNGRLTVQKNGMYYIYAQIFFETYPEANTTLNNRAALTVNGIPVSLIQTGLKGSSDYGSVSTGRLFPLGKGDYIGLMTDQYPSRMWITEDHSFFGAYRVSNIPRPGE